MAHRNRPRFMVLPGGVDAAAEQQSETQRTAKFARAVDAFVASYVRTQDPEITLRDTVTVLLSIAAGLGCVAGADAEQFAEAAAYIFDREAEARKKLPPPDPSIA